MTQHDTRPATSSRRSQRISDRHERQLTAWLAALSAVALLPFCLVYIARGEWATAAVVAVVIACAAGIAGSSALSRGLPRWVVMAGVGFAFASVAALFWHVGTAVAYWFFPATIVSFFLLGTRAGLFAVVPAVIVALGIASVVMEPGVVQRFAVTLLLTALCSYVFTRHIEHQRERLEARAIEDPLTGIGNRRHFMDEVRKAWAQHARTGDAASLLILDVDHFKSINDQKGHEVGDRALVELTRTIQTRLRSVSRFFRIGGEEFAVLIDDPGGTGAGYLAERLVRLVRETALDGVGPLTVSVGYATLVPEESQEEWIRRADDALYAAKRNGRDQVCAAEQPFREQYEGPRLVRE